ncbi:MAG: hypothetical protein QNI95_20240 [Desulfobacterales bacterium]|nr:hypothetical protein [Desulfobacterales bacterium]
MKKFGFLLTLLLYLGSTAIAWGVEFQFHGDMNNRFLVYTNRNDWFTPEQDGSIDTDSTVDDNYGEIKYRYWFEAADDDGMIKGVYAVEIGGIRFGRQGSGKSQGGSFSGDGVNIETRWAYLDFQLPFIESKFRPRIGLQPITANEYLWQETAMGINFNAAPTDNFDYQLAWIRTVDNLARDDSDKDIKDGDNYLARLNWKPTDDLKLGIMGLYSRNDDKSNDPVTARSYLIKEFVDDADFDIYTVGIDGSWNINNFFFNWNAMYQGGDFNHTTFDDSEFSGDTRKDDFDLQAWFLNVDAGYKMGRHKFTYRFWYASGDDDADDGDFEGYLAYDLDRTDSIAMFEGLYTDDVTYWSERPYMLDKGFVMNKLSWDFKWTEKFTVGAAGMYMMCAEDIEYTGGGGSSEEEDSIGFELQGYTKYMLFKNLELALNAGYLWAGDALDAFEVGGSDAKDGESDENIFGSSARIRWKF